MEFTAESYRSAATAHLQSAQWLHQQERYFLAHYWAGVAVECMLRAYLLRITREFDARHDLNELASQSRFYDFIPPEQHIEFGIKFDALNRRWRSNHRYATEKQLYAYLSGIKADFRTKGDRFKQNSRTMLKIAAEIVHLGEIKWASKKG